MTAAPYATSVFSPLEQNLFEFDVPRSILRSMDGAKAFLDPCLLKVPWLWRMDPVRAGPSPKLESDELRKYGKDVRSHLWVTPQPSPRELISYAEPSPNPL